MKKEDMKTVWGWSEEFKHLESDEDFRRIWWRTEAIPGSFTRLNAAAYYGQACLVPRDGLIVEIGVDQGRSASILAAVSEKTGVKVALIDSWPSVLADNFHKTKQMLKEFPTSNVEVYWMTSAEAARGPFASPERIVDLLHIDAHHYLPEIEIDCQCWLPALRGGGVVCFHDYGSTFPDVTAMVDRYTDGWEDLGNFDSLAIRQKP